MIMPNRSQNTGHIQSRAGTSSSWSSGGRMAIFPYYNDYLLLPLCWNNQLLPSYHVDQKC